MHNVIEIVTNRRQLLFFFSGNELRKSPLYSWYFKKNNKDKYRYFIHKKGTNTVVSDICHFNGFKLLNVQLDRSGRFRKISSCLTFSDLELFNIWPSYHLFLFKPNFFSKISSFNVQFWFAVNWRVTACYTPKPSRANRRLRILQCIHTTDVYTS